MPAAFPGNSTTKLARAATGGGFESAIENGSEIAGLTLTALDGTIAHGNRIRIEADASYAIGPKDQAAPKWWQMGQDVRIGGVVKTPEAIGVEITNTYLGGADGYVEASSQQVRHPRVDRSFLSLGRGNIVNPTGEWPATPVNVGRRYYQSAWYRPSTRFFYTYRFQVSAVSGPFTTSSDRTPGESVEITSSDGLRTATGQITYLDGPTGDMTVYFPSGISTTSDFFGGSVVGLSSGETANIDADPYGFGRFLSSSSTKLGRPGLRNRSAGAPQAYYTYGCNEQLFNVSKGPNEEDWDGIDNPIGGVGPSPDKDPLNWHQLEWVVDMSSNNDNGGKVYFYVDGALKYSKEDSDTRAFQLTTQPLTIDNIGMESSDGGFSYGASQYWGEIYADNDSRRIYICNAATVATSTAKELLRPDAWTENPDGSVVIEGALYQGALSSLPGKYLALVDGNTVIFEGAAL